MSVVSDFFDKLGGEMLLRTYQHVYITLIALCLATVVALPLGIYLSKTRHKKLASAAMGAAGVIQTVPTLALISFVVLLFALLQPLVKPVFVLRAIGTLPAVVALVLYALLPIMRNAYTGVRQVDPSVVEVARGMGMTRRQSLFQVELPLALPVIMAGLRIASVWTIGIATLCGLVGAGGLGDLIVKGLRNIQMDYLIAGTVPAAILALIFDGILSSLEKWLTPKGLNTRAATRQ